MIQTLIQITKEIIQSILTDTIYLGNKRCKTMDKLRNYYNISLELSDFKFNSIVNRPTWIMVYFVFL